MEEQPPTPPRGLLPDIQVLLLRQLRHHQLPDHEFHEQLFQMLEQHLQPHEFQQQLLLALEFGQRVAQRMEQRLQDLRQEQLRLRQILVALPPGNDFISLMAGTLTVHHCPMRPIKVKRYNRY
jgi:hypothetical protein